MVQKCAADPFAVAMLDVEENTSMTSAQFVEFLSSI